MARKPSTLAELSQSRDSPAPRHHRCRERRVRSFGPAVEPILDSGSAAVRAAAAAAHQILRQICCQFGGQIRQNRFCGSRHIGQITVARHEAPVDAILQSPKQLALQRKGSLGRYGIRLIDTASANQRKKGSLGLKLDDAPVSGLPCTAKARFCASTGAARTA